VDTQSGGHLSLLEKTALILVAMASILVWGVLALSASDVHERLFGYKIANPAIAYATTPHPSSLTPGPSLTLLPSPTGTPTITPSPTATSTPTPTLTLTPPASGISLVPLGDDVLVVALLGIDKKQAETIWRTDSLILAFVDRKAERLSLLSIPRDLWVYIPQYGYGRINTVDALGERKGHPGGGSALLDETLRYNLGVPVDRYVRIHLQGFVDLVDAVGGVTVNVEKPIHDPTYAKISLPAGPQHMDGRTALGYCRSRVTTSDFDRSRRQQQVLVALWEQALTPERLAQGPQLWAKFKDAYETDLTMVEAVQLARLLHGIGPENVRSEGLDYAMVRSWTTAQGAQVLLPRSEAIRELVIDLASPTE
jgi:LCP family protein required for cell wall assembly